MDRKIIIVISLLVVLLIAIVFFIMVGGRETLYVDPQKSVGAVGQSFTVDISVSNVNDLYGWEIKFGWNATVLDAVSVTEGSFLKGGGDTFFTNQTNNTMGFVRVDCTLLGDVSGVSGSGTLVTIQFYVKKSGDCGLDLYDTRLVNSMEQPIAHAVTDGYFNAVP